jgi:hypothetical protein
MRASWWERWSHRVRDAWDVLCGRAWAGRGNPLQWRVTAHKPPSDWMSQLRDEYKGTERVSRD